MCELKEYVPVLITEKFSLLPAVCDYINILKPSGSFTYQQLENS